jgi:hypothetical protein
MSMRPSLARREFLCAASALAFATSARAAPPTLAIKVYKDPDCGCCTAWADRLKAEGFAVVAEARDDMETIKFKLGVPNDLASCHTGVIDGYVIEGHVPPADIKRLVAERKTAKGLAVPGMPANSPGMEMAGEPKDPYTVWLFRDDGTRTAFAHHGG